MRFTRLSKRVCTVTALAASIVLATVGAAGASSTGGQTSGGTAPAGGTLPGACIDWHIGSWFSGGCKEWKAACNNTPGAHADTVDSGFWAHEYVCVMNGEIHDPIGD